MYSENPVLIPTTTVLQLHNDAATIQMKEIVTTENTLYRNLYLAASPMVSDAHFITPTDGKVALGLIIHSLVVAPTLTTQNGSKLGESTTAGYTGPVLNQ
jgi:hypothetical protein